MKRSAVLKLFVLLIAVAAFAVPGFAKKKPKTEPGKYEEWEDEIDKLEIVATFSMGDYSKIIVTRFESGDVKLPDKDDNTYEPVKDILKDPESPFVEGLEGELEKDGVTVEKGTKGGAGTLVISGVITEVDPGSQAARAWGGFGAGAASAHMQITVKDGGSGKVLLKIDQERRSGMGFGGTGYEKMLNKNFVAIGEDVALILNEF